MESNCNKVVDRIYLSLAIRDEETIVQFVWDGRVTGRRILRFIRCKTTALLNKCSTVHDDVDCDIKYVDTRRMLMYWLYVFKRRFSSLKRDCKNYGNYAHGKLCDRVTLCTLNLLLRLELADELPLIICVRREKSSR